jgi:hypothetical protein
LRVKVAETRHILLFFLPEKGQREVIVMTGRELKRNGMLRHFERLHRTTGYYAN